MTFRKTRVLTGLPASRTRREVWGRLLTHSLHFCIIGGSLFGLTMCALAAVATDPAQDQLAEDVHAWVETLSECMAEGDGGEVLESYSWQEQLDILRRVDYRLAADEVVRGGYE